MGCHRTATPAGRGNGRCREYGNLRTDLESPRGGEEPGRRARVHRCAQGPRRPEVAGGGAAFAARPEHRYQAQRLGLSGLPASKRAFARWRKTTGAARGRPGGSAVAGGAKLPASVGLEVETGWDASNCPRAGGSRAIRSCSARGHSRITPAGQRPRHFRVMGVSRVGGHPCLDSSDAAAVTDAVTRRGRRCAGSPR